MGTLEIQQKQLPQRPGVYIFRDEKGRILYVGKAKNLARRVMSYFQRTKMLEPAKQRMVKRIASIDTTITKNEAEALLLEATLIKRNAPPYNVVMRDDKSFMYITITMDDEYPTVFATRRVGKEKGLFFGPFPSAAAARTTVRLLKRLFAFRTCEPHRGRPCFDFHLGRCLGPCDDRITPKDYRLQAVEPIVAFLRGRTKDVMRDLGQRMRVAAAERKFELAASLRDRMRAVTVVTEKQNVVSTTPDDADIVSTISDRDWTAVNLFRVRQGRLFEKQSFLLQQPEATPTAEILLSFLGQFYARTVQLPKKVFVEKINNDIRMLGGLLGTTFRVPRRGSKYQLFRLGQENARSYLERRQAEWFADSNKIRKALEHLTKALDLPSIPTRIEAYDISNVQGKYAVGSMVVFSNGMPTKREYKKFIIRSVIQPDDVAMMAEMVERRLRHRDWPAPGLLLLDGGKGQLSAVKSVLKTMGVTTPVTALAKQDEELFVPGRSEPIILQRGSEELFLVQRIRDEAHRFAITFYRSRHGKTAVRSAFDDIPGIGEATRRLLRKKFRTPSAVATASDAALITAVGKRTTRILRITFKKKP